MHYAGFYTSGFASVDTLRIGNMTILNQAFEEATLLKPVPMWDDFFDSAIGLSRLQVDDAESSLRETSVFHNMIQQGLLDRNLFSLRLSDSRSNISGELRFASTNTDLYVEPLITFPVTTVYSPPDMDRYANVFLQAGWQVSAHSISLISSSSGTSDTSSFSLTGYVAAFSTVYPYIMLPQTVRESILESLGASLGVVDCDTVDSQPSLVISLGGQNNSSPFALKPWDYIRKVPKWTFDDHDNFECEVQIAAYERYNDDEPPDGVKFIVLGGAFLAQWYSVFDYDNATISRKSTLNEY